MELLRKLLAHAAIIISGMYFVFYGIDLVNPNMSFIDNGITKALLVILGVLSVINAIQVIHDVRRKQWRRLRKKKRAG